MKRTLCFLLCLLLLSGCSNAAYDSSEKTKSYKKPALQDLQDNLVFEAEAATLVDTEILKDIMDYHGDGYVSNFEYKTSSIKFYVNITEKSEYVLQVACSAPEGAGKRFADIYIDGIRSGLLSVPDTGKFEVIALSKNIDLTEGQHKINIINCEKDVAVDYIQLVKDDDMKKENVTAENPLVTPNAHVNAIKLYNYLSDNYGKRILSGQQAQCSDEAEINIIRKVTGKEPAVRGFDFMDYSPSRVARGTSATDTEAAIEWWKSGGIVTFCWHWNAPMDLIDKGPDKYWHSGFYTKATTFDLKAAMKDKDSEQYKALISDIDAIAKQLKVLEAAGVPVLWRPLHEASGGWFWWGAKGVEPCKELWVTMFDRLVNFHGLTNLIWVWNGQDKDWYPGDQYVDIIGEDVYQKERDYSSQKERFMTANRYSKNGKMVALSENGVIPDPDELIRDQIPWSWFCTWRGTFIRDDSNNYSEQYTEKEMLIKIYQHDYVITKDELPDFLG